MQSDIFGGLRPGHPQHAVPVGRPPEVRQPPLAAKNVYDLDSIQLIHMVHTMREEGKLRGEVRSPPPKMFIGAAANPFGDPFELRARRLAKKVAAGVDFVQTQCIYNMDKFEALDGRTASAACTSRSASWPVSPR